VKLFSTLIYRLIFKVVKITDGYNENLFYNDTLVLVSFEGE